jgi:thiol:disulfide interchange protein/DsbC/DsbD-like thiol-disulfide interchange protein
MYALGHLKTCPAEKTKNLPPRSFAFLSSPPWRSLRLYSPFLLPSPSKNPRHFNNFNPHPLKAPAISTVSLCYTLLRQKFYAPFQSKENRRISSRLMHLCHMKWFFALVAALFAPAVFGAHTQATLFLSEEAAKPGTTIMAAIHLKMDPNWHTYWKNPGDSGKATKIQWQLPPGVGAGEIQWPIPEKDKLEDIYTYVYKNEVALLVPITIAANAATGPQTLKAKVSWLECETSCIPADANVTATFTVSSESRPSAQAARFQEWRSKIPEMPKENTGVSITAAWDGPASAEERGLIFTVAQPSGAWDFFNYRLENADVSGKTDPLPPQAGKIRFRKTVKKWEGEWPKELMGLLLIPGDEKSARETTAVISAGVAPGAATTSSPAATTTKPAPGEPKIEKSLFAILGLAFLGGLILNIMPCVLPVIALKILGFVRQSKEDPKRIRTLGLVYASGVIVSFMVLAAFVIAIKQSTGSATWGMQFQNPKFLIFITTLVTLIALNLFGVFEITLAGGAMNAAGDLASREGASGAFFNGALATLLATPCTAPFLAPALGFAFTQSIAIIVLTFLAIAVGMAFPYVLLCWFPAWLKKLPKPGAWMEKFKNAMGFPMLATGIWLFTVSLTHFQKGAALSLGLFLVSVAFAAWLFGEFVQRGTKRRGLAGFFAMGITAFALFYFLPGLSAETTGGIQWRAWSPSALQTARAEHRAILVDFTADWCLTCQVNKKTSIEIPSVRAKIRDLNAIPFIADNTAESPEIAAELKRYNRAGVPLVLVFPADPEAPAIVLPEVLTPSIVLDALDRAASARNLKFTEK